MCMDAAQEKVGAGEEVKSMLKPAMFRAANAVRNLDHCNRQPRGDDASLPAAKKATGETMQANACRP